ncbi:hypothetical protein L1987_89223 [Smallanthus sonchifolius]|nr:hypothetical protein L1987_89223 [Smallanthus sonchifolius]
MRTVQEAADQTLSSVPGFISTLGQSYHSPDGMGCRPRLLEQVGKNTGLFLFSIVRKRSLVSHVPYVPSRYSHDSPLHLFSATVRFRSISGTVTALQSLYLQSLPRLVAPMVLKVFDSKKEKEKKRISPLVAKDTAYYRFE